MWGKSKLSNYPTMTTSSPGVGGIFNPPRGRGSGGDEFDVKRAGDADDLLRRYTYVYFVNSMRRAAAQVIDRSPPSSRDRPLPHDIFPFASWRPRGWSIAVWPWDRSSATRNIDNFSCTQCCPIKLPPRARGEDRPPSRRIKEVMQ